MRVGLEHIDPQIAAAMQERLCAPGAQFLKANIRWANTEETSLIRLAVNQAMKKPKSRPPEEFERQAYAVHRQREKMALQRAQIKATSRHELFYEVTVAEFQSVVPLLTLTDTEAAYCDLLTRVCEHDPNQEARRAVRRHISKVKEFVVLGRRLEQLAESADHNAQTGLLDRIEAEQDALIEAIHAVADALCTVLVVPSPAGDRASELIDKELQNCREAVETLAAEGNAVRPAEGKRRRAKVS
jgi:hypothetical protein